MKGIVVGGVLAVSAILLQASSAPLAEEHQKAEPCTWTDVKGLKRLKVSKMKEFPELVLLQLTDEQLRELQENPLDFYNKYSVFETRSTYAAGQATFNLMERRTGVRPGKDPAVGLAVHGSGSYSAAAAFQYDDTKH